MKAGLISLPYPPAPSPVSLISTVRNSAPRDLAWGWRDSNSSFAASEVGPSCKLYSQELGAQGPGLAAAGQQQCSLQLVK